MLLLLHFFCIVFFFTLLSAIEVYVLLINELLKLLDLLAVELDSHFMGSCDEVRMDLHLELIVVVIVLVLVPSGLVLHSVVLLVVDPTVFVSILFSLSHHALFLLLFFPQLIKPVFLVVSVSHDASDGLCSIFLFVSVRAFLAVRIILHSKLVVPCVVIVKSASFVDFFSSGNGVFEVDRHFIVSFII